MDVFWGDRLRPFHAAEWMDLRLGGCGMLWMSLIDSAKQIQQKKQPKRIKKDSPVLLFGTSLEPKHWYHWGLIYFLRYELRLQVLLCVMVPFSCVPKTPNATRLGSYSTTARLLLVDKVSSKQWKQTVR